MSTNESTEIIIGHMIFNPSYSYKFLLKTSVVVNCQKLGRKIENKAF